MKRLAPLTLALAMATQMISSTAATADTWWEIGSETLYFEDGTGGMGVFVYLDGTNQPNPNMTLFIEDMEAVYYGSKDFEARTYNGYMVNYATDAECGEVRTDPYGQDYSFWETATMTFGADWQYFTLVLDECGKGRYTVTHQGTPGQ